MAFYMGSLFFEPSGNIPSSYETNDCCAISGLDAKVSRVLKNAKGGADYGPLETAVSCMVGIYHQVQISNKEGVDFSDVYMYTCTK